MYNPLQSGPILFHAAIACLLTLILGAALLALYRRAVARGMRAASSGGHAGSGAARRRPAADLRLVDGSGLEPDAAPAAPPARLALAHLLAGLAFALTATALTFLFGGIEFLPIRTTVVTWAYAWPTVVVLWLLRGPDLPFQLLVLAGYAAVIALLGVAVALVGTPPLPIGGFTLPAVAQPFFLWAWQAWPGLLLLLFLNRTVRAVGPMLLLFLAIGLLGSNLAMAAAGTDAGFAVAARLTVALGLPASLAIAAIDVAGFVLAAPLAWLAVQALRRRYAAKRTSDQLLVVSSIWLAMTVVLCSDLAFEGGALGLAGALAFLAYRFTLHLGLRPVRAAAARATPRNLLLLRVFGFRRRSGRLFDLLTAGWRRLGPVQMIAAPDLASRSVEPGEFLAFLGGRLGRLFVRGPADLERRLAEFDFRPDPDGRYRVNELFCSGEAWRQAVQRLMVQADLVAMDLRSFGPANAGCVFELQALLDLMPLERLVLLVDRTTDRPFLERTLRERWQELAVDSPNAIDRAPRLLLLEAGDVTAAVRRLEGLAAPTTPGTANLRELALA